MPERKTISDMERETAREYHAKAAKARKAGDKVGEQRYIYLATLAEEQARKEEEREG